MRYFLDKIEQISSIEESVEFLFAELSREPEGVKKALDLAIKAHKGQTRKSGEPYVVHPIFVAALTANISNDETMVQAALLHDVVEDTPYGIDLIATQFGEDVAHLVEGLTKIVAIRDERLASSDSNEKLISSALSFRKMLIASIKDVRVLVIKLCDRLHNMITIDVLSPHKQKRIAEETLVVYAPIAHRLGISKLKKSLEDLSFAIIYPEDFAQIDSYLQVQSQHLQIKLNSFISKVENIIIKEGFDIDDVEIIGRVKHHYSVYLKMHRKGIGIDEVLDLLAIRIILKEPIDCYRVLGLMHLEFTPLIARFKDYIALPKENGYQTIHTTLFDEDGIVEVQIRTSQMHQLAEYGIAAHWKYKEGVSGVKLSWLEGLEYQNESVEEFYELAKGDLFSEDISVFSPKGDYFTLPKGSVAIDFAYIIHSEIGAKASGVLINKEEASLLAPLKNGDIVKILTDKEPSFHCSWIDTAKTSRAKDGIRSRCKARLKENNQRTAKAILSTIFDTPISFLDQVLDSLQLQESIYRAATQLDYLKDTISKVANYIGAREVRSWELFRKGYKKPLLKSMEHFTFYANKPIASIEFDYCCHPKTNDEIVAFYEKEKAIIHHKLCKKAYAKMLENTPMVYVQWRYEKASRYRLIISLQNQKGVLADLLTKLSKMGLNVMSIELGIKYSDTAEYCQIEVESMESKKSLLESKLAKFFKVVEIVSLDDAYNK
ncbi:MAG TPA: bifunctional (p)ppGpp synthetase/guanosine-3',5'-bis(diphosphate) 3'-pyrophosphohydrolase [Epsilonproteobacteria bacterium]|nr:bifunctional (p)ppGpp synthetase/guanosine-3',5'-bis(diphosphate) 3'-pyrophosphohydrolase [Campylobacterota bacterium]